MDYLSAITIPQLDNENWGAQSSDRRSRVLCDAAWTVSGTSRAQSCRMGKYFCSLLRFGAKQGRRLRRQPLPSIDEVVHFRADQGLCQLASS